MKYFLILLFILNQCNYFQKKEEDSNELILILSLVLFNSNNRNVGSDYNCTTSPSPKTFSEFLANMDSLNTSATKCSGCHGIDTAQSNFIITNYTSLSERVVPSSPERSTLYLKVKSGGAMAAYSNDRINQNIYCYIFNGASQ